LLKIFYSIFRWSDIWYNWFGWIC